MIPQYLKTLSTTQLINSYRHSLGRKGRIYPEIQEKLKKVFEEFNNAVKEIEKDNFEPMMKIMMKTILLHFANMYKGNRGTLVCFNTSSIMKFWISDIFKVRFIRGKDMKYLYNTVLSKLSNYINDNYDIIEYKKAGTSGVKILMKKSEAEKFVRDIEERLDEIVENVMNNYTRVGRRGTQIKKVMKYDIRYAQRLKKDIAELIRRGYYTIDGIILSALFGNFAIKYDKCKENKNIRCRLCKSKVKKNEKIVRIIIEKDLEFIFHRECYDEILFQYVCRLMRDLGFFT